jgi:hypothetical protein
LVFANKMRHACVEPVYPKTTRTAWKGYLGKAHPGTFELAWPKIHALPLKHNPFLLVICPSAVGAWVKHYDYHNWHTGKANFPPSFRPYLQSIHCIRNKDKDPPNMPLWTWDEEVAAKAAQDNALMVSATIASPKGHASPTQPPVLHLATNPRTSRLVVARPF